MKTREMDDSCTDVWHVSNDDDDDGGPLEIRNKNRLLVAAASSLDDARRIVREHNSYADLLRTLRDIQRECALRTPNMNILRLLAREAIARVEHARAAIANAEVQS